MPGILNISDAASLGIHATALLAMCPGRPVTTVRIAKRLNASEAHLSKVLQRLARARLVVSTPGPGGGFKLSRPPDEITVLEVYEAVDGPLHDGSCLFSRPLCPGGGCLFGPLLQTIRDMVSDHMVNTRLSTLAEYYGRKLNEAQDHPNR